MREKYPMLNEHEIYYMSQDPYRNMSSEKKLPPKEHYNDYKAHPYENFRYPRA
jgi:hypothetical protein